jgi:hypothetical protein
MQSVVVVPRGCYSCVSPMLLCAIVRTSSFVTMSTVRIAIGACIATTPNAAPCAFERTCRKAR